MLTVENCSSLVQSNDKHEVKKMAEKIKYVVLNKEGLTGKRLETEAQVSIEGKPCKAGDVVELDPDAHDTKYLLGQFWVEPKDQPKPKVELDTDEDADPKSKSKKGKK